MAEQEDKEKDESEIIRKHDSAEDERVITRQKLKNKINLAQAQRNSKKVYKKQIKPDNTANIPLINLIKGIQYDRYIGRMSIEDTRKKYAKFAKTYPPIFDMAATRRMTVEDMERMEYMINLSTGVNSGNVDSNAAWKEVDENIARRYAPELLKQRKNENH